MTRRLLLALALVSLIGCAGSSDIERVVIVTLDTTRADHLGCYGYDKPISPNLDQLAAESTLFENAISHVPTTLPSHSTMFTGMYPQDLEIRYNLIDALGPKADTLAERLQAAGFKTAAFPAAFVLSEKYGLDQGFDLYVEPNKEGVSEQQAAMGIGGTRNAEQGVDDVLNWLNAQGDDKSFVWLHFYDPHSPYSPPFPYSSQYRDAPYDGEIAYTDAQFGRLMDRLRSDPQWDKTLVIVAGDHGEGLHEHRERWHSYLVYETTQHVPFIVRAPGHAARRVAEPAMLSDITPTVLDLVGLEMPEEMRGVSLRPALQGKTMDSRFLYFETQAGMLNYGWQELNGLRFQNWKLIDSSEPELYDVEADPGELNNLAASDPDRLARYRAELNRVKQSIGDAVAEDVQMTMSPEEEAALAALGYVANAGGGDVAEDARTPQSMIDVEAEIATTRTAITRGQWGDVEDLCRYILSRDKSNKWALTNLTLSLLEQGRADEAEEPSMQLAAIFHQDPNSYATRGRVLSETGRATEAYEELSIVRRDILPKSEAIGYFLLVAGFDAGADVCGEPLGDVMAQFGNSARILVMKTRCDLRQPDGVDTAMQTLEMAVRRGYDSVDRLREFPEFKPLVEHPYFETLLEIPAEGRSPHDGHDHGE